MDKNYYKVDENELPLDKFVSDGGYCAIFRSIGCIGDSLSSGEFELVHSDNKTTYHDIYEQSWGQYIARKTGAKVYNFSRGGMSCKEFIESFGESIDAFNKDKACQAYIIALGINDLFFLKMELGSVDDINLEDETLNKKTFAGYYGMIISKYKRISPNAKFFFMTLADDYPGGLNPTSVKHREFLYDLVKIVKNSYVLDILEYGPKYDDDFKKLFYLYGHMNPMGYKFTADMVMSYIDFIIRHNPEDFKFAGLINILDYTNI